MNTNKFEKHIVYNPDNRSQYTDGIIELLNFLKFKTPKNILMKIINYLGFKRILLVVDETHPFIWEKLVHLKEKHPIINNNMFDVVLIAQREKDIPIELRRLKEIKYFDKINKREFNS